MISRLCVLVLAAAASLPLFADVTDDAIKLTQAGASADVIVAWAQHQGGSALSAQDILRLRDAKVPDEAITALMRSTPSAPSSAVVESTRYVEPLTTSYVYSDPYYSSSYPYYSSYGYYPYHRGYYTSGYYPSVGLSFNFGSGRSYGGYRSGGFSGGSFRHGR